MKAYNMGVNQLKSFEKQIIMENLPLITNPKVFPSLCKVTSTVLKMTPEPCTAEK